VLYLLIWLTRNPALIYRRGFHLIVLAAVLPLGLSLRAEATGLSDDADGTARILVEFSQSVPPWLWFGLASLCVLGDSLMALRETKAREALYGEAEGEARIVTSDGRALLETKIVLTPGEAMALSGARFRLQQIVGWDMPGSKLLVRTQPSGPAFWARPDNPQRLAPDQTATLTVRTPISASRLSWLRLRARLDLFGLAPSRAYLTLQGDRKPAPLPVNVRADQPPLEEPA
jgi:hypothetical protein